MELNKILGELYSIDSPKFKLGLTRMRKLLKKLGSPEKGLKYIHIAGTNGKGSTCAILHSILSTAVYRTGLYTSPHLKKFNERIRINNKLISDKDIVRLYKKIKKQVTNESFFEITTALAFLYFAEKKCDFVILETGLGGRLDATNVIKPLVSVITSISLEHTNILGNSIRQIAKEKAAIIKNKIPVVTGTEGVALSEIKKFARTKKAPVSIINEKNIIKKFNKKNNSWEFDYNGYKNLELKKLRGSFQIKNAVMALQVTDILIGKYNFNISETKLRKGIETATWPARFQLKSNVLNDCAHNIEAFQSLFKEISYFKYKKLIMVVGFSKDKSVKEISKMINKKADTIILTSSNNPRSAKTKDIEKYFSLPIQIENPKKALQYAKKLATKKDIIVFTGSIYVVGELC